MPRMASRWQSIGGLSRREGDWSEDYSDIVSRGLLFLPFFSKMQINLFQLISLSSCSLMAFTGSKQRKRQSPSASEVHKTEINAQIVSTLRIISKSVYP